MGKHHDYLGGKTNNTQKENTKVVTYTIGNTRNFKIFTNYIGQTNYKRVVKDSTLKHGTINVLLPSDELKKKYKHGVCMNKGISVAFVCRVVENIRVFDKTNNNNLILLMRSCIYVQQSEQHPSAQNEKK